MITKPNVAELIRRRVELQPVGEPFTPNAFLDCGKRATVDQTLSRLVKAGKIDRIARGIFVRPEMNRFVGKVSPDPMAVAKSISPVVQLHGAEAAWRLGLTTQVPTQAVYETSGPSKRIRIGGLELRLRHVSERKLALADHPAGVALAAMWYLGKREVKESVIEKIRQRLSESEFEVLKSATKVMPGWMSAAIIQYSMRTSTAGIYA